MSIVLAIAGKKYTVNSSDGDHEMIAQAAHLLENAAADITKKHVALPEGRVHVMAALQCVTALLQQQEQADYLIKHALQDLQELLPD